MELTSSVFRHEGKIPSMFTCDGENISPGLSWRDAPAETQSFTLVMHDPDAPRAGGFTHWILYDVPATVAALEQNVAKKERIPSIGVQGKNDFGKIGYLGPCPPTGTHRYFLLLYALDVELNLKPGASYGQLQQAIRGHVLEQTELMGKYARTAQKAA